MILISLKLLYTTTAAKLNLWVENYCIFGYIFPQEDENCSCIIIILVIVIIINHTVEQGIGPKGKREEKNIFFTLYIKFIVKLPSCRSFCLSSANVRVSHLIISYNKSSYCSALNLALSMVIFNFVRALYTSLNEGIL